MHKPFLICYLLLVICYLYLVGSSGLEPPTLRLSGARSNHLSYEPKQPAEPVVIDNWQWTIDN